MLGGRILVVEDDPAIATVVEETLRAQSYEVVATGAADALRLVRELHPDVIVLDYTMPGVDGAEIGRRLHADRPTVAIPIIAISAGDPEARPRLPKDEELRAMATAVAIAIASQGAKRAQ